MTSLSAHSQPVLEVRNAYKSFGAVSALSDVSLCLQDREVLALLGDNGAGKSTLIKALSGVHRLDRGEVYLDGQPVEFRSASEARFAGIETVYQDLALFDNLSADANFFIGREHVRPRWLGRLGLVANRRLHEEWRSQAASLGVKIKTSREPVAMLSGGQRQAIAVARAVAFARRIVILDEPTAALGIREASEVLRLIAGLPASGMSVILISHNLDHVSRVADRAVVMRQGIVVSESSVGRERHQHIVSLIVGASTDGEDG